MGEHFDPTNRLARQGYFSEARVTKTGKYVKVRSGTISQLHGLPHTRPVPTLRKG